MSLLSSSFFCLQSACMSSTRLRYRSWYRDIAFSTLAFSGIGNANGTSVMSRFSA